MRRTGDAQSTRLKLTWVTPEIARRDWFRFGQALTDNKQITPLAFLRESEGTIRQLADAWHQQREQEIADDVWGKRRDRMRGWPDEDSSFRKGSEVQTWFVGLWRSARGLSDRDPKERSDAEARLLFALTKFRDGSTLSSGVQWTALRRSIADTALLQSDLAMMRFIEAVQAALPEVKRCKRCDTIYIPKRPVRWAQFCSADCRKRHGEEKKPRVRTRRK